MERIFDHLKCPRDRLAFKSQCPRAPLQTEICLDADDPNGYLSLMRQKYWTSVVSFGMPSDIAYWGRHLERLEIRTDGSVPLNVVEFLPKLKRLRVACSLVSNGIGWKSTSLERVEIITSTSVYVHPELGKMPNLTHLSVEAGEIRGDPRTRLPASLTTVRFTGTVRDEILNILSESNVEFLVLRRAMLCEMPPLPPRVRSLDLSGNYMSAWDRYVRAPSLRRLILSGNVGFDLASLRDLCLEYLDARGTEESYPSLTTLRELVHSHDPPSDVGARCPAIERITVKNAEYIPIPGACVPKLTHHGYFHPAYGHLVSEPTPPPSPPTQWRSFIDDIGILYQR